MPIVIAIVLFLLILAVVGAFGYHHYVKPTRMLDQLTFSPDNYSTVIAEKKRGNSEILAQLLKPIGNLIPLSPQDNSLARRELVAAGIRSESAVQVFFGLKLLLAALLLGVALFFRS
jgi:hypothetical protein